MPKVKNNDSEIQLRCTLCPKTPQFSDVSHLLTHISSKSHLSHRFKLQIRGQSESTSRQQLDDFDHWYYSNNLDVLLSGRLAAKEQKKAAKGRNGAKFQASSAFVKEELESTEPVRPASLAPTPLFRATVPRMHLWPTTNTASTPNFEWEQPFVYTTPTARRQLPNFSREETPANTILGGLLDPQLGTPEKQSEAGDEKANGKMSENIKLKGIYWPGMDLFDSATPEMKRMRNQRKDGTVLEQMMATSTVVEPVEFVYHADGELRNTRDIFDPPSIENSPENIKMPTPKKRKCRSPRKATFDDISINSRMRRTRSKKATTSGSPKMRQTTFQQPRGPFDCLPYKPQSAPNPLAAFGNRFMATSEEDEEFQMTIGDITQKRPFGIFQDSREVSPGRTESPLEEPRFDFLCDGLPKISTNTNQPSQSSPTPLVKPVPIKIFGKENNQPDLPTQVHSRRTVSTSHSFAPQVFYDPTFNPLYNPLSNYNSRALGYDYPPNYSEGLASANGFNLDFHGEFKPPALTPRSPSQQRQSRYSAGRINASGSGMHYRM